MSGNRNERSLLQLAASVISAVQDKADHYRSRLGPDFDPLQASARSLESRVERELATVADREGLQPGLINQLDQIAELIRNKAAARHNAPAAEGAIRDFVSESPSLLLLHEPSRRALVEVDAKLSIVQTRRNLRNGASNEQQLEEDIDEIGQLAGRAQSASIELASAVLRTSIALLDVAEDELREGEETLKEIKRAIDAAATVIRIVTQALALIP